MIRVVLAENENLLRESLKGIIEINQDIKVVGCASDGMEAFRQCTELLPDVVLMDLKMPVCDGIEGTRLIKEQNPSIKIVILTTFDDEESISKAVEKGANGYILKSVTPEELVDVIKNAAKGFFIFSRKTGDTLLKSIGKCSGKAEVMPQCDIGSILKENELSILRLIADGYSNKRIAEEIYLSEGRVKNIISEILDKLGLKDRYQLLSFAYKNNLID